MQRGRPRDNSMLWASRQRKARRIRERLGMGGEYVESNGTTWRHAIDASIVISTDGSQRIYRDIDAALDAEI